MSSYLADLAARSLGQVPVAQPRLASRFEPVASGPAASATTSQDGDASVEPNARAPRTPAPAVWAAVPHRPDATRAHDRADLHDPPPPRRDIAERRDAIPPQAQRPIQRAAPELPIAAVPRVAESTAQPAARQNVAAAPRLPETSVASVRPALDRQLQTIARPVVHDEGRWQRADERLSVLEHNLSQPDRARPQPMPRGVLQSEPTAPRPLPRNAAPQPSLRAAAAPADTAGAPEAPVVHVTIGRIDVRAITAPTPTRPARRAAAPRPALSLDDYLKQRSSR